MATIINNPANQGSDEGAGIGFIFGILVVVLVGFLFFIYALPALRDSGAEKLPTTQNIEIQIPAPATEPTVTE